MDEHEKYIYSDPCPAKPAEPEIEPKHIEYDDEGRAAWEAYSVEVGGTAYNGNPLPTWEELGERQRNGWRAAAAVVKPKKAKKTEA